MKRDASHWMTLPAAVLLLWWIGQTAMTTRSTHFKPDTPWAGTPVNRPRWSARWSAWRSRA